MTIDEARKLLGKEAENVSDEIIKKDIEAARLFVDIMIDKIYSMTDEERSQLLTKK